MLASYVGKMPKCFDPLSAPVVFFCRADHKTGLKAFKVMEASTRVELVYTDLQSAA